MHQHSFTTLVDRAIQTQPRQNQSKATIVKVASSFRHYATVLAHWFASSSDDLERSHKAIAVEQRPIEIGAHAW
jgi:hypothetical protein